ncbi:hypothetical protein MLD52_21945 [Puniceicoccaceae bacterium K14]|nr:hypothetical protein [Puniceicoccaceae bacterium K14]
MPRSGLVQQIASGNGDKPRRLSSTFRVSASRHAECCAEQAQAAYSGSASLHRNNPLEATPILNFREQVRYSSITASPQRNIR